MTTETSPASGRLERRKARTRAAIVSAASTLFRDRGYDDTSIQQIAELADTGVGTVYGYFASKEHVLAEVMRSSSDNAVERYRAAITPSMPSLERILLALDMLAAYITDNQAILKAALQTGIRGRLEEGEPTPEWIFVAFRGLVARGVEKGELRPVPVDSTARVLITIYMQALLRIGLWQRRTDAPEALHEELTAFTRALLDPAG